MTHDWFPASGGGLLATMWLANPMKVALLKPSYVPQPDSHKVWADIAASELDAAGGYAAGGQDLATRTTVYDGGTDRTNLLCADNTWLAATFSTAFAAIYDNSGAKALWSLVNFEGVKDVTAGTFTIDWAAVGTLYVIRV